jgi:hypothetical protein
MEEAAMDDRMMGKPKRDGVGMRGPISSVFYIEGSFVGGCFPLT